MDTQSIGRVLIIAGSDSGGGAGMQADIKTCAAFGVYSASAITAITAQNTLGVQKVEAISAPMVSEQIRSVLVDIGADVIKIGMLANADIVHSVADIISELAPETTIVLDPVLAATSGDELLEGQAVAALKDRLLPLADMVTPNTQEAEILTGIAIEDVESMIAAGEMLLKMGAYSALMKGGHLKGKSVVDVFVTDEGSQIMSAPRLYSRHTHGTGCTLASAVAASLALGMPMDVAVQDAREFVFEAIRTAPKLGKGNGPLNHGLNMGEEKVKETAKENPFAALKGLKD